MLYLTLSIDPDAIPLQDFTVLTIVYGASLEASAAGCVFSLRRDLY